ncbi:MAG: hypothetical protein R3E48_15345 [Burkholderiaceae bacterium]
MKNNFLMAAMVGTLAGGLVSVAHAEWVSASNGAVPAGSVVGGQEAV